MKIRKIYPTFCGTTSPQIANSLKSRTYLRRTHVNILIFNQKAKIVTIGTEKSRDRHLFGASLASFLSQTLCRFEVRL